MIGLFEVIQEGVVRESSIDVSFNQVGSMLCRTLALCINLPFVHTYLR